MLCYHFGDIFDAVKQGKLDVVCHGLNCEVGVWGYGFAKIAKSKMPNTYLADLNSPLTEDERLGTIVTSLEPTLSLSAGHDVYGAGIFTQRYRGATGLEEFTDAFTRGMTALLLKYPTKRIGIVRIGGGLARIPWETTEAILYGLSSGRKINIFIVG